MSSDPPIVVPFPLDIGSPFAEEFLIHPDYRVIIAFLLGCVFWSAISYICRSQFFQLLGRLCWAFVQRSLSSQPDSSDIEAQTSHDVDRKPQRRRSELSAIHRFSNDAALTFALNLCFTFTGFAEFCSLLVYDPHGDAACAFTVAWGSMAAQAARLIGLAMLVLRLLRRGASNVEFYCLCSALVVGLGFILAYTATNTGSLTEVRTLNSFLCNRPPWVPTALLSSVFFILLELYMGGRLLGWDAYKMGFRAMLVKSANMQVARACSLLLLDLLTVAPNAGSTDQLARFIPLSVGSLIVLGVYNYGSHGHFTDPVIRAIVPVPSTSPGRSSSPLPTPQGTGHPLAAEVLQASMITTEMAEVEGVLALDGPDAPSPLVGRPRERQPMAVPNSAPPRIGDASVFAEHQTRQILPFQVQYAEQLDRHVHTGPVVMPFRVKPQRPTVKVVIEEMQPQEPSRTTRSSIIGSDIVRMSSAATSSTKKQWSPESNATPSDYTVSRSSSAGTASATRTPTTVRDSTMSMLTASHSRSLSSGSHLVLSAAPSRQPSRRKLRSPGEVFLKPPWRLAPRTSVMSVRTFGGREELPMVVEGHIEGTSGSRRASRGSALTKRIAISRPHSLRSRPSSPQIPHLGVQHLPSLPTSSRPSSSQQLTVPDNLIPPVFRPVSRSSVRPSSQYIVHTPTEPPVASPISGLQKSPGPQPTSPPPSSYQRAQGSGRLRGPRSPPTSSSMPNIVSGWPGAELGLRAERRRSGSCPELPPLDLDSATL